MFDHWLIQRCFVDAILELITSATTRLQAEDIPTGGSYNRPAMRKKCAGVLYVCQCRLYQLTGNSLCLRKWGTSLTFLRQLSWNQDISKGWLKIQSRQTIADHRAGRRSWHFAARWLLIAQFQSTDASSDDLHAGCRAQWHQRG